MRILIPLLCIALSVASCQSNTSESAKQTDTVATTPEATTTQLAGKADIAHYNTMLQGKWISTTDPNSVIMFSGSYFIDAYEGSKPDTFNYTLSATSCADPNTTNNGTVYLSADGICHAITGLSDTRLELMYLDRGNTNTYKKAP